MEKTEIIKDFRFGRGFLKITAMLSMLCDHIAFVLVPVTEHKELYYTMRAAGRISFPLFCFMLTEGFTYTRNREMYIIRLAVFAVISEIPFDLACSNTLFCQDSQNVMWTLLAGFIVMYIMDKAENRYYIKILAILSGSLTVYFLKTDYSIFGVLLIVILYISRYNKKTGMAAMAILILSQNSIEMFAILSIPFILNYNPGKNNIYLPKYFFYVFYPAHLFILYIIYYFFGSL